MSGLFGGSSAESGVLKDKGRTVGGKTSGGAVPVKESVDGAECLEAIHNLVVMPNCRNLVAIRPGHYVVKRALDFVGALILILLFTPLLVIVALMVGLTSKGPILYAGRRVGLCGRLFPFFKFRTMQVDAEQKLAELLSENEKDGPIFKIHNDPRVTPVGAFLRRTSLDELPQLFNVLRGEMSLVGPRPPIPREVVQYDELDMQRLRILPGITCYWQIMGRSRLTFKQWMELDRKYIEEMSLLTDLRILLRTPVAVFFGDGAY